MPQLESHYSNKYTSSRCQSSYRWEPRQCHGRMVDLSTQHIIPCHPKFVTYDIPYPAARCKADESSTIHFANTTLPHGSTHYMNPQYVHAMCLESAAVQPFWTVADRHSRRQTLVDTSRTVSYRLRSHGASRTTIPLTMHESPPNGRGTGHSAPKQTKT